MTDEPDTAELENRIDKLESTIEKMMPSRRDALKMGGAALVGGAAMSGRASAGTNQVGTIGSQASPVDLESEDINNADTITTQNIVVSGTATGPFGGGVPKNFTYNDKKSSRSLSTVFTNTTGKALYITVSVFTDDTGDIFVRFLVDGVIIAEKFQQISGNTTINVAGFVPDGANYEVVTFGNESLNRWFEAEM